MPFVTREELIAEFEDTKKCCEEERILSEAIELTNARVKVYTEDFSEEVQAKKAGRVRVESGRTFEAAIALHEEFPEKRIGVLNFAASGTPGGGVKRGAYAQEESLCRCSTLYPSLLTAEATRGFYDYHRNNCGWEASDRCVYSPDVIICRDDRDLLCDRLPPAKFAKVDVITCAAPHLFRDVTIKAEDLLRMHISRAKNILRAAAHNGVDIFVGGAFGCGAFHNDGCIVAWAWREALKEYQEKFDLIDFVIYISDYPEKKKSGETNFIAFRNEFTD